MILNLAIWVGRSLQIYPMELISIFITYLQYYNLFWCYIVIQQTFLVVKTSRKIEFAGNNFTLTPSTLKSTIEIFNWPFDSMDNNLVLTIQFQSPVWISPSHFLSRSLILYFKSSNKSDAMYYENDASGKPTTNKWTNKQTEKKSQY